MGKTGEYMRTPGQSFNPNQLCSWVNCHPSKIELQPYFYIVIISIQMVN